MKNSFKTTILIIVISCGFYACTEDYFEFDKLKTDDWRPVIAVPLVNSSLSIADLVTKKNSEGFIQTNADNNLEVVYKSSVISSDGQDIIAFPPQIFKDSFETPFPIPSFPPLNTGQKLPFSSPIDLSFEDPSQFGIVVDSITLKSGSLSFTFENTFKYEITINARFRTFTDSLGDTLVLNYILPASNGTIPSVRSETVELKGYQINMSEDKDGNPADNRIPIDLNYEIQLIAGVGSSPGEKVRMTGAITNLEFNEFYGSMGSTPLNIEKDSIAIDFFKNFQAFSSADFFISNPSLLLTVKNSFSGPMNFEFLYLDAINSGRNPSVVNFNIPIELQPLAVNFPAKYGIVETKFELNRNNSNIDSVLSHLVQAIKYDSKAQFNPGGVPPRTGIRRNFMTDTSDMRLDLEFRIPFEGRAVGFFIEDTVAFEFENSGELNNGVLRLIAENSFPLAIDLQISFLDSSKNKITDLILPSDPDFSNGYGALIPGAPINSAGESNGSSSKTKDISISRAQLEQLSDSKFIALSSKLSTTKGDIGANVVFRSDNRLNIILGLKSEILID